MNFDRIVDYLMENKHIVWMINVFGVLLLCAVVYIRIYFQNKEVKNVQTIYNNFHYAEAIISASKLKSKYFVIPAIPNARTNMIHDQLCLIIASSALRTGDHAAFHENINEVCCAKQKFISEMWLTVYYLSQHDEDTAKTHYDLFRQTPNTEKKIIAETFLESLWAYRKKDYERSVELITSVKTDMTNPVMKDFAHDVIKKQLFS